MASERHPEPELEAKFPRLEAINEDETSAIARALAGEAYGGLAVLLTGCLGSGKTTFVRCLATALGVMGVKSPTFATESVHKVPGRDFDLIHVDLYRFEGAPPGSDVFLQLEEHMTRPCGPLLLVEWGDRWELPALDGWGVGISIPGDGDRRSFDLSARGLRALERLSKAYGSTLDVLGGRVQKPC
jgi:tRNA threonylcarbamoyladenosine biosynthesis protein TsaE